MNNFNFPVSLLFAIIFLSCSSPSAKTPVESPPVSPRNDLPNMVITSLDESKVDVHLLKENTILILFQPNCDHCQREAREIRENLNAFKKYSLYFISADQRDAVEKFGKDYDLMGHTNVHFALTTVDNVLKYFGAVPAPSVYIYADQKLVQKFIGEVRIDRILQSI